MKRLAIAAAFVMLASGVLAAEPGVAEALVVIVNPQSGVERLTKAQVVDIFMGRYRKLPSGRAALPIDLGTASAERRDFYGRLVDKSLAEINSYWARLVFSGQSTPPFQAPDAATAVELVAGNPNAIAYVARSAADDRVRIVLELAP